MTLIVRRQRHTLVRLGALLALLVTTVVLTPKDSDADLAVGDPYHLDAAVDTNPAPDVFETTIVAKTATVDIGGGVLANAWTYNGTVPGPEIRVKVGDTVVVHFKNELPQPSSIHWHGIELSNASDGTTLTQNGVPTGGTFLYKFTVPRPGGFWYHPHHRPTNPVFKGQYGSLIVADPHEGTLMAKGVLPPAERTKTLVLSDVTVCKEPGQNDDDTYDDSLPWSGGGPLPEQRQPFPSTLCDTPVDDDGNPVKDAQGRPVPLQKGDIPNIQRFGLASFGRTNEGQTVLTNGRNTGGRAGSPEAPGELAAQATTIDVAAGQGYRFRLVNAATVRFMRLRMTDSAGRQIPIVRIGAEGGLLNEARVEGGVTPSDDPLATTPFDHKYAEGEVVLDPSDRADVVVAVPRDAPLGAATIWTLDFKRTGEDFPYTATVPVAHLNVTAPTAETYSIAPGTPLRTDPDVDDPVEDLGRSPALVLPTTPPETDPLLDPATFSPPKPGSADENIRFTTDATRSGPAIDGVEGHHDAPGDYTTVARTASTRYAALGDVLELTVTNETAAHHAFHLHGFSFQPIALEGISTVPPRPSYTFRYPEFVDTQDIPRDYVLRFRVRLDDRPLTDGTTPGGGKGRWSFHCHIFFHSAHGMHAELIVTDADGNEKPYVNADTTSVAVAQGEQASATGTFSDPDNDAVQLSSSIGTVADAGGGRWSWQYDTGSAPPGRKTVYVTATDARGSKDQVAFDVAVGNTAPVVAIVSPPSGSAFPAGAAITVAAALFDVGPAGALSCRFDWDDGGGLGPPIAADGGRCSDTRTVAGAGGYTVRVVATDAEGATGSDARLLVVHDPTRGSATGKGTVVGAGGPASFDFSARNRAGRPPVGHLKFSVPGGVDFRASTTDWLLVSGTRAQMAGAGAANGVGGARFLLTVHDGGAGGDALRLKVWDAGGAVVYDNVGGAPDDIDTAAPQPVTSGAVVVDNGT